MRSIRDPVLGQAHVRFKCTKDQEDPGTDPITAFNSMNVSQNVMREPKIPRTPCKLKVKLAIYMESLYRQT